MTQGQRLKVLGATITLAGLALAMMLRSPGVQAQDDQNNDEESLHSYRFQDCASPAEFGGKEPGFGGIRQLHC